MRGIARKSAPINVIVHYPKTEQGKRELAERVAGVHADMVNQYIKKLNCPSDQKAELLGAVIASAKRKQVSKPIKAPSPAFLMLLFSL